MTMKLLAVIAVLCLGSFCYGKLLILEAESAKGAHDIKFRSNASGGKSVWLGKGQMVTLSFCLIRQTTFTIENIYFSNDGGADTVDVAVDGQNIGSFKSPEGSKFGQFWDLFRTSGQIGHNMQLHGGWNIVTLTATATDFYGVEIDKIEISVSDDEINEDIFKCKLTCSDDLPMPTYTTHSEIKPGRAVQRSYKTQCTEEDNVNVPIFHENVTEFEITASAPLYRSFRNDREKNTANCKFISPVYWEFTNLLLFQSQKRNTETSQLTATKSYKEPLHHNLMEIRFMVKGRKHGYIDSEIGSTLFLTLQKPSSAVDVEVSFEKRDKTVVHLPKVKFTQNYLSHTFNIPDFTWKEDKENKIILRSASLGELPKIANVRLERRAMIADKVIKLYSSDLIIVEGVEVDFWWRAPESMELSRPSTGENWKNIAYFRIYISLPYTKGFSQLFVMYQDGNVRLLNPPPPGMDWSPFGSSVLIGQTDPDHFRPSAPVARVEIEPEERSMKIVYADCGSCRLTLVPSFTRTLLYVSDVDFKKSTTTHPFVTLRSSYVAAGNNDADSLMTDMVDTQQIVGNSWKEIAGTSFKLFRRCESKHLTQSPDINLQITKT